MSTPAHTTPEQSKVVVVNESSPTLELRQWPLRDEPIPSVVVLCVVVAISVGLGYIAGSTWWGLAAVIALLLSLWRMWVPVEIRFSELGVVQTALRRSWRIPWESIAAYEVRHAGVLLLPDDDSSLIGRLKGLYIGWGDHQQELLSLIEHYLGERA